MRDIKSKEIEILLSEAIFLIEESLGHNPFKNLEKSLAIIIQGNYNQFPSIKKKVGETIIIMYGDRFENVDTITKKLDVIY